MSRTDGAAGKAGATDVFPRLHARTRRFSLGLPRTFALSPDGARAAFLRSASGEDAVHALWVVDLDSGQERVAADPRALGAPAEADLPAEERARRERLRESGEGIVSYATDRAVEHAVFALGGALWLADLRSGETRQLNTSPGVFDPRLDPTGHQVAYVRGHAVEVIAGAGGAARVLAEPADGETSVTWGRAEFVAAEEMGRMRGFWWSPSGDALAVARVDETPVTRWHIADPSDPAREPQEIAYPAAGTANALVQLWVIPLSADAPRVQVRWDAETFPYLADVLWGEHGPLTLVVQSRDQRTLQVLSADPATGETRLAREEADPQWVELVGGVPRWLPDGRLLHTLDEAGTRRLAADGVALTPEGLQVRRVVGLHQGSVVFAGGSDPTTVELYAVPQAGGDMRRLGSEGGVSDGAAGGGTLLTVRRTLGGQGPEYVLRRGESAHRVGGAALPHGLTLNVRLLELGPRALRGALVLPAGHQPGDGALPVLLDPYGGPHAQRVLQAGDAYLTSQWFADQGFAVLIVDGRGTPGRGPAWERAVAGDLATAPLEDQVDALRAAAELAPGVLDLGRVAIRGWSFGGYLAALAVLRRPDVFHAAIAGAPVTDWALYDTHYTERYLGTPQDDPAQYRRSSLIDDAPNLTRPLLLIHGLADDNVVAAHTLRLSGALLAAGRPHEVLPLSNVTHMTPQEVVAENLLRLQLDFLRRTVAAAAPR